MRKTYNKGERVYVIAHAHQTYNMRGRTVINEVLGPFRVVNTTHPCDDNEGTWHKLQLYGGKLSQWLRSWTLFADKDEAERYVFFLGTICLHPLNCDILRLAFEHSRAEMHRRGIALDCDDPLDESGDDDDDEPSDSDYDYIHNYTHNYIHNFLNASSRDNNNADNNDDDAGNTGNGAGDTDRSSHDDNTGNGNADTGNAADRSSHDDTSRSAASDSHCRTPKTTNHI